MLREKDWRITPASNRTNSIYLDGRDRKDTLLTRLGVSPIKENLQIHHLDFASSSAASSCYQDHYAVPSKKKPQMALINGNDINLNSSSSSMSSDDSTTNNMLYEPSPPLNLKDFQPLLTSTTTSFYPHALPKTNPRHGIPSTPRTSQKINLDEQRNKMYEYQRRPRVIPKSDHFGLPSQIARRYGSKGILYLSIGVSRHMSLTVSVRNAIFFLDPTHLLSTFVRLEIKPKPSSSRKRTKSSRRYFDVAKTNTVSRNNSPEYFEVFKFKISNEHCEANDLLSISVYATINTGPVPERELIGCMAFPLKKMFNKGDGLNKSSAILISPRQKAKYSNVMREFSSSLPHQLEHKRMDRIKKWVFQCDRRTRSRTTSAIDRETITVASGGYFLLGKDKGKVSHLSESKISHRKYYDEIGGSTLSTCSSAVSSSPIKMIGETDWRITPASSRTNSVYLDGRDRKDTLLTRLGVSPIKENLQIHHLDFASSSAASSCYQNHYDVPLKKRQTTVAALINGDSNNMSPTSSSSSNSSTMNAMIVGSNDVHYDFSSSNSSLFSNMDYKNAYCKRNTVPSILTTSDTNSGSREEGTGLNQEIDYHLLYADMPPPMSVQEKVRRRLVENGGLLREDEFEDDSELDEPCTGAIADDKHKFNRIAAKEIKHDARKIGMRMNFHPAVRRVASFTSPPTKTELAKQQRENRKGFIGKTLNYFKNKVDGSMSQSTLYPSHDEVKSWQEKMENLLENKYGCMLFGEFLDKEYSRENLDFVLKCREYKKLFSNSKKNQKKISKLGKEIFENYLEDNASQEVNLESTVKAATKKAYKDGFEENTFSLAQNKIEQLLDNDKYGRFLQSSQYTNLIENISKGSQLSIQSANPDIPHNEDLLTTPLASIHNDETPLAPQSRTLRSASAIENGVIQTIIE